MRGYEFGDHESCLKFSGPGGVSDPRKSGAAFESRIRPWGQLLNLPQFRTVDELWRRVHGLPLVSQRLIQDRDILGSLGRLCKHRLLVPIGRVDGDDTPRTMGHLVFANPEFTIRLLEDYEDCAMFGIRWWNRDGGEREYGGEVFGGRLVCVNYNLWGPLLGQFHVTHERSSVAILESLNSLLNEAIERSPILSDRIEAAQNEIVQKGDVENLLYGTGLLPCEVRDVARLLPESPEVAKMGLTLWTLYNAVTSYATHRPRSGIEFERTEALERRAVCLLTSNQESLIRSGARIRMADWHAERRDSSPLLLVTKRSLS